MASSRVSVITKIDLFGVFCLVAPGIGVAAADDLLVGAWRFAESAVNGRYEAACVASDATAWEAPSAAGALLLFSHAQLEIRELLEPPELQ